IVLAVLHILAPLGNLWVNAHYIHQTIFEHWHFLLKFMPMSVLLPYLILPVLAGIFIFICKRWSYWAYLVCLFLIFAANVYGFSMNPQVGSLIMLLVILLIDLVVVAYFVVPAVRNVYLDPRLRWWEAAPRYTYHNSIDVNGVEGAGTVKNISEGGLFAVLSQPLFEGQSAKLTWLFEGKTYQVDAKVVYKSARSNVDGYGVQFAHTPETQKQLKLLCSQLRERGQLVPDRLPTPEDSFVHWLKNLVTKREGLFPKR
ncbi:MAG TPA: PilZ domain-containing protein, partial [Bdellovibrio sp.]|nr:PilZ domain-containing protein [Bdellovibrio sp.]